MRRVLRLSLNVLTMEYSVEDGVGKWGWGEGDTRNGGGGRLTKTADCLSTCLIWCES